MEYPAFKRNELSGFEKTWTHLTYTLLNERSQSGKAIYCMIPTLTSWKRQSYGDSGCLEWREVTGDMNGQSTLEFEGSENTLNGAIVVNISFYICGNHSMHNIKSEPQGTVHDYDVSM